MSLGLGCMLVQTNGRKECNRGVGNLFANSIFLQFRLVTRVIQKSKASPLKSESELIYKKAIHSLWCNTFEEPSSHSGEQWGVLDSAQSMLWNHAPHPSKSLDSWEIVLCTYQHAVIVSSWERILPSTLFSTDINVFWPTWSSQSAITDIVQTIYHVFIIVNLSFWKGNIVLFRISKHNN